MFNINALPFIQCPAGSYQLLFRTIGRQMSKPRQRSQSRTNSQLQYQSLENRQLLAALPLAANYTTDAVLDNADGYYLNGHVKIHAGVTVSIAPDVSIWSERNWYDLIVEGTIDANNSNFIGANNLVSVKSGGQFNLVNGSEFSGVKLEYEAGSTGSVVGSTFNSGELQVFSGVRIDGNVFKHPEPIRMNPAFANEIYDNTFSVDSRISLAGTMLEDAELKAINNLSRYHISSYSGSAGIRIIGGVELKMSSGVSITSDRNWYEIDVEGTLDASNAKFIGSNNNIDVSGVMNFRNGSKFAGVGIDYRPGSSGLIAGSTFNSGKLFVFSSIRIDNNTFEAPDTLTMNPEYVPEIYNNTFSVDSRISLAGTVLADADLRVMNNMSQYHVSSYSGSAGIVVAGGVTVKISPGVSFTTDRNWYEIRVDGTLDVNGATFLGANSNFDINGQLVLRESSFSGNIIDLRQNSRAIISCSTISSDELRIHYESVTNIHGNSLMGVEVRAVGTTSDGVIDLRENYWGTISHSEIRARIEDKNDNNNLALIEYDPFLESAHGSKKVSGTTGNDEFAIVVDASQNYSVTMNGSDVPVDSGCITELSIDGLGGSDL
ncbi:MAG: hypothetical protein AB8B55_02530, partial [Mariniblastus sp.]